MKTNIYGYAGLFAAALMMSCSGSDENHDTDNDDVVYATEESGCLCESSWFDGTVILPPNEGDTSVFADTSTTNCDFHQWSWQKFLYLTQVPEGQSLPYFLGDMMQVNDVMAPVDQTDGKLTLEAYQQAGGGGILSSNGTYGETNTVYYSIHINTIFEDAALSFEEKIAADPSLANNRFSFPVGALELKASWVDTLALSSANLENYYTTTAYIDGEQKGVALLGLHVVGVVENHPEFIWATFEHSGLAAFYNWEATSDSDVPVTSAENLPFFNSNDTANLADIQWPNKRTTPMDPNNVFTIYEYGTPRVPGGGFMNTTSQTTGEDNFNNIDTLNLSVHDTLTAKGLDLWTNYFYNGSIWMNMDGTTYDQQIDSIIARKSNFGDANSGGPLRGSLAAFNITMETYEQTQSSESIHAMTVDSLMNCFVCHGPQAYLTIGGQEKATSALYISHLFMNYMHDKDSTASVQEIRNMRFELFNQMRNRE